MSVDMVVVGVMAAYQRTRKNITVILTKHCIELPDDGFIVIRNMLEQF